MLKNADGVWFFTPGTPLADSFLYDIGNRKAMPRYQEKLIFVPLRSTVRPVVRRCAGNR